MSAIKEYLRQSQEIENEMGLIAEELYLAMLETQMTDWIFIDENDSTTTNSNCVTNVGST